jgi:hypothetical protein
MSDIVDRALRLWGGTPGAGDGALDAFRAVYTDPVVINGQPTPLQVLADRARMMQKAFDGLTHTIHERFEVPGRQAFAFQISGRLIGPLATPLGDLAPTGQEVQVTGMDIFLVDEGADRVTAVWAVADYLSLLMQAGAVELVQPRERNT